MSCLQPGEPIADLPTPPKPNEEDPNSIPQLTWMAHADGHIFWYNDHWYEYTGTTPEEMAGWGWQKVHHPKMLTEVTARWQHSIDTGEAFEMNFPLRSARGEYRWFLTRVIPIRDDNGQVVRWLGTNTDIQLQRDIANDLKLKSDAIENSLNGFDIVNEDGKIVYANRAYLKMWGYDHLDEIIGTSPAGHCADPGVPMKIMSELKTTGKCDIEFVAQRKDGSTFDVRMLAFLAHDNQGKEIYPTTSIDITEEKRAAAALTAAKNEAERANELKTAFLANMSHEIRTPLGAMMGFAELLKDTQLSEADRASYVDIIIKNGEQLSFLINDILDISKVESGHMKFDFVGTNPEQIANSVVSLMGVKAREKGIELKYHCEDSTPRDVTTDPIRVRQVLLNLVGNAIKFTKKGTVTITSAAETTAQGRKLVTFEVSDSGMGVPIDQVEKIFEMFVQADGSMTRRFGGTGLGLALSRKLARSLGGDVVLKTPQASEGSTFVFSFLDEPHLREDLSIPLGSKLKSPAENALKDIKVLVVDDSADNRVMMEMFLAKEGALVDTAEDGVQGVQKALHEDFDLILMDIQMPRMDGYTATQRLREAGYKIPIVAVTAHAMSEVRRRCLEAGCTDHMAKPIQPRELVAMVARYTEAVDPGAGG